MSSFDNVDLKEMERAVNRAESFDSLRSNLQNIQSKAGNHNQLFEQHMREILFLLEEIEQSCENGMRFNAIRPRFNDLPDSLITAKAVELASDYYDETYAYKNGSIIRL